MLKHRSSLIAAAALLMFGFQAAASFAQQSAAASDPQLAATAKKLYQAIASGNPDAVMALSKKSRRNKISAQSISLPETGPKLKATFDGNVEILRSDGKHAVVAANFYTPESKDIPAGEVKQLRIYFEKENGGWLADSPDRKEAMDDATLRGGWYHAGSFTFCPNQGLVYLPNHFSTSLHCRAASACER